MDVDDFHQMYSAELQELRSVEEQLVQAVPTMADKAQHPELKQALLAHLDETRSQRDRLEVILRRHGAEPRQHVDGSMQAIIAEADRWSGMVQDPDLRDASLTASMQRVEHYEIAIYGTLASWARQLGFEDDRITLEAILAEEKRADEQLTMIAERLVNPEAATS